MLPCACANLRRTARAVTKMYNHELRATGLEVTLHAADDIAGHGGNDSGRVRQVAGAGHNELDAQAETLTTVADSARRRATIGGSGFCG